MKPVANLVIEMAANVARLEKDMARARSSVDGAMQKIRRSAQMAMRALGALGLGLGAAQLTSFVKKAIDAGDQMMKLSQQTGIAVQNIAGLQLAFRQGGGTAADMEMAINRLVIGMDKQSAGFKKLNLQSKDTFGALSEIADIFQKMPDGLEKSALSNDLFGRSGSRLIPILNQGAAGLQKYIELSQKLGTSVTPEVAKQFEKYNDTMDTVGAAMEGLAMQAATALVPALQSVADALINLFESGAIKRGIDGLVTAFQLLAAVMASKVVGAIAGVVGRTATMAAGMTVATGATAGLTVAMTALNGVMAFLGGPVGVVVTVASALIYFTEKSYDAANSAEALATELGIANGELETMKNAQIEGKLVDIAIEMNDLAIAASEAAAELDNLNSQMLDPEAYAIQGGQNSSALAKINQQIAIRQELLEKLKGQLVQNTEAEVRLNAVTVTATEGTTSNISALRELIAAYEFQTDAMTMTNAEKETAIFLQKVENEGVKEGSKLYAELTAAKQAAISRRQEVEASIAQREAEKQQAEERLTIRLKAEEEFQREADMINNQIGQSLTDALMNGGMKAKDFLINMFKTLVLRPILQPVISGVLGAMGVGTAGAALAGGMPGESTMSGALGLGNLVSTVKSVFNVATTGFAAVGDTVAFALQDAGAWLVNNTSGWMNSAGATMMESSAAMGTAATALTGIAAGITSGTLISGQYSVAGDQMVATGIGTAAGAVIGSVVPVIGTAIGAAIGGTLGGVVNRAFGMGATTTEATGIGGFMSTTGAKAEQFEITKRKGGWFRSDKINTNWSALDQETFNYFDQTARAISDTVIGMADSLGISAEKLDGFSRTFMLDFKGLSEEQIQAKIQEEFGYFADALAETINPELRNFKRGSETASQILSRLSGVLTTVNNSFDILGFTLYEASLSGADAAQQLIDLFGGVENFTAATSFYYDNFYSQQERANKQLEQMTELFSTMGLELPNTRDAFRAMVDAAQAAGNPALLTSLMQLAPAFDSLLNSFDSLRQSLEEDLGVAVGVTDAAFDEVRRSLQAQLDASITAAKGQLDDTLKIIEQQRTAASIARDLAGEAITSLSSVFQLLTAQIADLSGTISVSQTAMQARMFIRQALESARNTGYLPNAEDLGRAIGQARAGLSSDQFMTAFEQRRETLRLQNELIQLQELSGEQLTEAEKQLAIAEATLESLDRQTLDAQSYYEQQIAQAQRQHDEQLEALERQINEMRGINTGIMSLADAMNALAAAIGSEMSARVNVAAAVDPRSAQISKIYDDVLERAPDQPGLDYWVKSGLEIADVTQSIINSTENRIQDISKMYDDILDRAPDAKGLEYWANSANTLDEIAKYIEESPESRALRGFANGGYASPGMAIVGERGPELVDFQRPAMVYTNSELRNAMGGGDTAVELRQLRQETQAQSRAMVAMQARMTRVIEQWNGDGLPQERFEGATA